MNGWLQDEWQMKAVVVASDGEQRRRRLVMGYDGRDGKGWFMKHDCGGG